MPLLLSSVLSGVSDKSLSSTAVLLKADKSQSHSERMTKQHAQLKVRYHTTLIFIFIMNLFLFDLVPFILFLHHHLFVPFSFLSFLSPFILSAFTNLSISLFPSFLLFKLINNTSIYIYNIAGRHQDRRHKQRCSGSFLGPKVQSP
jgi:hypothetical protein